MKYIKIICVINEKIVFFIYIFAKLSPTQLQLNWTELALISSNTAVRPLPGHVKKLSKNITSKDLAQLVLIFFNWRSAGLYNKLIFENAKLRD